MSNLESTITSLADLSVDTSNQNQNSDEITYVSSLHSTSSMSSETSSVNDYSGIRELPSINHSEAASALHRIICQLNFPNDENCSICFNTMLGKIVKHTPCGHRFCSYCLTKWQRQLCCSTNCPNCRAPLFKKQCRMCLEADIHIHQIENSGSIVPSLATINDDRTLLQIRNRLRINALIEQVSVLSDNENSFHEIDDELSNEIDDELSNEIDDELSNEIDDDINMEISIHGRISQRINSGVENTQNLIYNFYHNIGDVLYSFLYENENENIDENIDDSISNDGFNSDHSDFDDVNS